MTNQSALLVDVRTDEEWANGHVVGAIHLPVESIMEGKFTKLPKDATIYTYCRGGVRAEKAKQELIKNGFIDVHNAGTLETASAKFGAVVRE